MGRSSASSRTRRAVAASTSRPPLHVAMVGHAFMGRAHGNAWRQANRFFDLPRSQRAHCVGLSVMALIALMNAVAAMTSANCR